MLAKARSDGTLDRQLTILSRPKLLIIHELGYLPFEAKAGHLFSSLRGRKDASHLEGSFGGGGEILP